MQNEKREITIHIIMIGLLAVVLCGCQRPADREGSVLLMQAREAIERKEYAEAKGYLDTFLTTRGSSREAGYAYYLRGHCHRISGELDDEKARADFETAIRLSKDPAVKESALVALGHIHYEANPPQYEQAVGHYEAVLEIMDEAPPKDVVLFRLGVALQGLGRWSRADLYLSRCMNRFGHTDYGRNAERRFGARHFSIQVAALTNQSRAEELIQRLRQAGYEAFRTLERRQENLFHEIRVGRMNTYKKAREKLGQLTQQYPDAIIVASQ